MQALVLGREGLGELLVDSLIAGAGHDLLPAVGTEVQSGFIGQQIQILLIPLVGTVDRELREELGDSSTMYITGRFDILPVARCLRILLQRQLSTLGQCQLLG